MSTNKMLDATLDQIKEDVANNDLTAIAELLKSTTDKAILAFLSDERMDELRKDRATTPLLEYHGYKIN